MNSTIWIPKWLTVGIFVLFLMIAGIALPLKAGERGKTFELKVALLPILDTLPFYVAQDKGYFDSSAVKIIPVPVSSGLERDQLMQAGAIDAMLNEMTTTANFNRKKVTLKILIALRMAYPDAPMFRLLSSPGSGITSPKALADVPIGVSENTIIEYVTDRMLEAEGLRRDQIVKKSVPIIPERYQLLMQNRLKAVMLPDPLGKSALEAGALPIIDDAAYPHYSVSVFSFHMDAVETKPMAIRFFLKAWDKAAEDINADPEAYRSLLVKKIRVPRNIQTTFPIPPFPRKKIPDARQWADVMEWMVQKGLLSKPLPYGESVSGAFLP